MLGSTESPKVRWQLTSRGRHALLRSRCNHQHDKGWHAEPEDEGQCQHDRAVDAFRDIFGNKPSQASQQPRSVDGTAGNQAEKACTSAITARAPYGPWTDDMIAVLGQSQELTFTFFYQ